MPASTAGPQVKDFKSKGKGELLTLTKKEGKSWSDTVKELIAVKSGAEVQKMLKAKMQEQDAVIEQLRREIKECAESKVKAQDAVIEELRKEIKEFAESKEKKFCSCCRESGEY